ncbi:hypothetical protein T12_13729 [Trichinella patagoniensis]|uniref:Uncharacterized protein n=1 Tax=Trichinella patagoniensis TaxID=990121 RepID=A0A0V0YUR3_9BILA|nr:hypothetical protein T12_13729 [Trichinella patagoniensis]
MKTITKTVKKSQYLRKEAKQRMSLKLHMKNSYRYFG